jgi:biopolymer transport protein ExbB/TolQ
VHNKPKTTIKVLCCFLLCIPLLAQQWQRAAAQTSNPPNPMELFEQRSNTLDQQLNAATTAPIPNAQATVLPAPPGTLSSSGPPANFCVTDAGRCPLAAAAPAGQNCLCTAGNQVDGGQTENLSPTSGQPASANASAGQPTPVQPTPPPALQPPSASNPPVIKVSILGMARNSDAIVQGVILFLLLCSACSWAAFFYKSIVLGIAQRNTRGFSTTFKNAVTMDNAVETVRMIGDGGARQMLSAAKQGWDLSLQSVEIPLTAHQSNRLLQRLVLAMGTAQERALTQLSSYMGLLATVGSTAPFIGLFGTVWGILDSFEHISASATTSLAVVAPGIAEALLATAVGLFTAIPATMFYNHFAREIGKATGQLDNVAAELVVFASRDVERLNK